MCNPIDTVTTKLPSRFIQSGLFYYVWFADKREELKHEDEFIEAINLDRMLKD